MGESAPTTPIPPELEDFGLTAEVFASVPEARVGPRRVVCFLAVYGTATALVFLAALALSGSLIGAVFFGVLLTAAGSVLLVPAITGLVCALEHCEHSWLCRRHARYRAANEYRKAVRAHQSEMRQFQAGRLRDRETFWRGLNHSLLVAEIRRAFASDGSKIELIAAQLDTGIDMVLVDDHGGSAIRCISGGVATGKSLGRELVSAARDMGSHDLILVAPWGVDPSLEAYLREHRGTVVDSVELARIDQHHSS